MTPAPLTLTPVGVGPAYARPGEAQSCYLVRAGGRAVCLDLGAGALNRLQAHVAPQDLELLVISHLHPDHCADLLSLRVYMAWGPGSGRRLRVLAPEGTRERMTSFAGEDGWDRAFAFEAFAGDRGALDLGGGLELRYREVPHLKPTYAVRLDLDGRSLVYGADCAECDELAELARDADLLVAECSSGADPVPDGLAHLDAGQAAAIANRAGARRLLLTHCYPEHDRDAALARARSAAAMPVDWALQDVEVAA
ncbi:MAG: MBL fold metallo-hydrolase [Thermoleophilia bacterium]